MCEVLFLRLFTLKRFVLTLSSGLVSIVSGSSVGRAIMFVGGEFSVVPALGGRTSGTGGTVGAVGAGLSSLLASFDPPKNLGFL